MGNTFGKIFNLTTFGESHATAIGGVIDGCPAGLDINLEVIQRQLERRRPGISSIVSSRKESDTVEFLATGVRDRVFFATNKSTLTTASRDTLRKQAAWMRKKKSLSFTIEGHADERGTREYNLALGERRANAVKDYLMTYGISGSRLNVISYGKERPVNSGSTPLAWSQNRRSVTVKAN